MYKNILMENIEMKVQIEASWLETDKDSGQETVGIIEDGVEVSDIEDRYSVSDTATAIDMAWKWINEMYNIPSPTSVKNLELRIKFIEKIQNI